jgi:hypothetical protein
MTKNDIQSTRTVAVFPRFCTSKKSEPHHRNQETAAANFCWKYGNLLMNDKTIVKR